MFAQRPLIDAEYCDFVAGKSAFIEVGITRGSEKIGCSLKKWVCRGREIGSRTRNLEDDKTSVLISLWSSRPRFSRRRK